MLDKLEFKPREVIIPMDRLMPLEGDFVLEPVPDSELFKQKGLFLRFRNTEGIIFKAKVIGRQTIRQMRHPYRRSDISILRSSLQLTDIIIQPNAFANFGNMEAAWDRLIDQPLRHCGLVNCLKLSRIDFAVDVPISLTLARQGLDVERLSKIQLKEISKGRAKYILVGSKPRQIMVYDKTRPPLPDAPTPRFGPTPNRPFSRFEVRYTDFSKLKQNEAQRFADIYSVSDVRHIVGAVMADELIPHRGLSFHRFNMRNVDTSLAVSQRLQEEIIFSPNTDEASKRNALVRRLYQEGERVKVATLLQYHGFYETRKIIEGWNGSDRSNAFALLEAMKANTPQQAINFQALLKESIATAHFGGQYLRPAPTVALPPAVPIVRRLRPQQQS